MTSPDANTLLTSLLRDVSRSFYLTLRVLPAAIRVQIGVAYLLARATDTIADTEIVSLGVRLETLLQLRSRILGQNEAELDLGKIADQQGTAGERALLQRINEGIQLLKGLSREDCELVRDVLATIIGGQELDLKRFGQADSRHIIALQAETELDDYTYRVAGCVGEFWTKICLQHLRIPRGLDQKTLIENGIRFGKGLQMVNILRDLSADLLKGRCYIPESTLSANHLQTKDLLNPTAIETFRPLYDQYLDQAEQHLAAGWNYTNTLPYSWVRVRLACAWPILIGLRTISHLRKSNPLDGARRIKASRAEVKRLMAASLLAYPVPRIWNALYRRASNA